MSTTPKTGRKPTHAVSHVRGEGERAYWTKIGVGWLHDDKEGLNIALDYLPVNGDGRFVIRVISDDKAKAVPTGEAA